MSFSRTEITFGDRSKNNLRRLSLLITAVAMVAVYILWNIPQLTIILYPLRLFVTYIHESAHALAALLTGGRVIGFIVSPDGSGLATTAGGTRWIVSAAGYLGTALFGSVTFYLINRFPQITNPLATVLGFSMVVFSLMFARPDEATGLPLALFLGVGFGVGIMVLGLKVHSLLTQLVLNVIAVSAALEAFIKLRYIAANSSAGRGEVVNDATAFAQSISPFVSGSLVAITWAAIALLMFAVAFYYGAWKPLRREIDDSYEKIA